MAEIIKLLNSDYEECIEYLLDKYGFVPGNYFYILGNNLISVNNDFKKANQGLYVHHIDENENGFLSNNQAIIHHPQYQPFDKLVYCNLLERLVLHIKIFKKTNYLNETIFKFIIPELNDIYSNIEYQSQKKKNVAKLVKPFKNEYFQCLKLLNLNSKKKVDSILSSNKDNEKIGWNIEKNQKLFKEIKAFLKYDNLPLGNEKDLNQLQKNKQINFTNKNSNKQNKKSNVWKIFLSLFIPAILSAIIFTIWSIAK
ncbi:hypothetical protein [Metamycoplasma alkalescens]|uniref:Uncharacterized protein n=2 Tax=Metamycoplasma alkalescens TaxID=45363 RepID=A0A318UJQ0_9BACT|nr:hypothetical protein [Metamycoplasma alkalescens]PYF43643.1 hypothetical protein BCF88_10211 [Metamycoplasma alkalescens]